MKLRLTYLTPDSTLPFFLGLRLSTGASATPNAARTTEAFRLSGTTTRGTAPSSLKASTCSRSHVSVFWSNTMRTTMWRE